MLFLPEAKKEIICWTIATVIPVIVVPTVYCCTGFNVLNLSNSCAIIGIIYLGVIALWALARQGVFDIFAYQFSNWASSFRKGSPKKYKDVIQYKEIKKEKRMTHRLVWMPFVVIGALLIILAIIFAVCLI